MRPGGKNKKSNIDVGEGGWGIVGTLFLMVCCKKHPFVWKCLDNFVADYGMKNFDPNGSFIYLKFTALCKKTGTLSFKSQLQL